MKDKIQEEPDGSDAQGQVWEGVWSFHALSRPESQHLHGFTNRGTHQPL